MATAIFKRAHFAPPPTHTFCISTGQYEFSKVKVPILPSLFVFQGEGNSNFQKYLFCPHTFRISKGGQQLFSKVPILPPYFCISRGRAITIFQVLTLPPSSPHTFCIGLALHALWCFAVL